MADLPDLADCLCPPKFQAVREAFLANFQGDFAELGARFVACIEGEPIVDLVGGYADRARTLPFGPNTLAPIFSTSKAAASLMMAWRVGRGGIDYGDLATALWPQFGQAGKAGLAVEQVQEVARDRIDGAVTVHEAAPRRQRLRE